MHFFFSPAFAMVTRTRIALERSFLPQLPGSHPGGVGGGAARERLSSDPGPRRRLLFQGPFAHLGAPRPRLPFT